ncbi:MAG TPA: RyR domain-containing protein [Armatimonadota bacterium]|nr:RyR domain-containing protein [Armatimonadota bacterium]
MSTDPLPGRPRPSGYKPRPIDTTRVTLTPEILELTETLARSTHDNWARRRLAEGWRYGPHRNDGRHEHPGLVPYESLSESEKDYDRSTALETLKAILALGYKIEKGSEIQGDGPDDPADGALHRRASAVRRRRAPIK